MDADTLVLSSLKDLTKLDLKDNYVGAVLDLPLISIKKNLNFSSENFYFNAGFVVFNLFKLRKINFEKKIIYYLNKNVFTFPDQDVINLILKNKILKLPVKYNLFGYFNELKYKNVLRLSYLNENEYYSKDEINNAINKPVFVHFLILFADVPWKDYSNPLYNKFKFYANLTPFDEEEIYKPISFSKSKIIFHKIAKFLPEYIFFFSIIAKFYLKIILNKKKL